MESEVVVCFDCKYKWSSISENPVCPKCHSINVDFEDQNFQCCSICDSQIINGSCEC